MSIKTIKATAQDMICDARYAIKCTWAKIKQTRLARLPDFKHDGLQTTVNGFVQVGHQGTKVSPHH